MTNRTFAISVLCSAVVHSVAAVAVWQPWQDWQSAKSDSIQISYIKYVEEPKVLPPVPKPAAATQPRPPVSEAVQRYRAYKKQAVVKAKSMAMPVTPPAPAPTQTAATQAAAPDMRTSADLLADPKSKEVFESYFVVVKDRIHQVVRRKYSRASVGEGQVALVFILRSDGRLENVWTVEKMSKADILVKNFARTCVRDAAPFPKFPESLGMNRISFNITIIFDEM